MRDVVRPPSLPMDVRVPSSLPPERFLAAIARGLGSRTVLNRLATAFGRTDRSFLGSLEGNSVHVEVRGRTPTVVGPMAHSWHPQFDGRVEPVDAGSALNGRIDVRANVRSFEWLWLVIVALFLVLGVAVNVFPTIAH